MVEPTESPADTWSSGDAYESYIGRWSRLVARDFLSWVDTRTGLRWLDVGCGTGALATAIARDAEPAAVLGVDPSAAYVEEARRRLDDTRVRFEVNEASHLGFDSQFDVVVSALVLNFLPDPQHALSEMRRAVVDGGLVASYVWDYSGRMELIRYVWDAPRELDESARELDEGVRFPLCDPGRLTDLWRGAGLQSVEATAIEVPTRFASFDDFWSPFLGGQGPAPGYVMSLSERKRERLRDAVHASLPVIEDGSISLIARAWAVRGQTALP